MTATAPTTPITDPASAAPHSDQIVATVDLDDSHSIVGIDGQRAAAVTNTDDRAPLSGGIRGSTCG